MLRGFLHCLLSSNTTSDVILFYSGPGQTGLTYIVTSFNSGVVVVLPRRSHLNVIICTFHLFESNEIMYIKMFWKAPITL